MDRRKLSPARRRDLLFIQKNRCADCGCVLNLAKKDRFDADHVVALGLGGGNDIGNFQALCPECHAAKTRRDMAAITKVRRWHKKAAGIEKPKRKIQSRGFDKSLTKKVSGKVVPRE